MKGVLQHAGRGHDVHVMHQRWRRITPTGRSHRTCPWPLPPKKTTQSGRQRAWLSQVRAATISLALARPTWCMVCVAISWPCGLERWERDTGGE